MSDIDSVRALIGDPIQYDRATFTGDAASVEFQLPNYPIVVGSDKVRLGATAQTRGTDYTIDEEIGLLTFSIAPGSGVVGIATSKFSYVSDAQIQECLDLESSADEYIKLASADVLDAMASSQALIQKKIKLLDLQTDGPALAKALQDHAATLRKQVFDPAFTEATFDIIEMINDRAGRREKRFKDWERMGGI